MYEDKEEKVSGGWNLERIHKLGMLWVLGERQVAPGPMIVASLWMEQQSVL